MAGRTEHVDLLAAEITSRGLAPIVLHGSGGQVHAHTQPHALLTGQVALDRARTLEDLAEAVHQGLVEADVAPGASWKRSGGSPPARA